MTDIILDILSCSSVIIIISFNSRIIGFFPALLATNNLYSFPAPELEAGFSPYIGLYAFIEQACKVMFSPRT